MPWNGSVRVIAAAPQLAELNLFLAANLLEPKWLHAAFDALNNKRDLTATQREQLNWARPNLFTVGDFLESIGSGWSYATNWAPEIMGRFPGENPLGGDIGRWDTNIILAPEVIVPQRNSGVALAAGPATESRVARILRFPSFRSTAAQRIHLISRRRASGAA